MSMSGTYNPKGGLITENEYIMRRVEAILGRAYIIRINGVRFTVNSTTTKKERLNTIRYAKAILNKLHQKSIFLSIDCVTRTVVFESIPDMGGDINGIPYPELFMDTPFEYLKVYEKLW